MRLNREERYQLKLIRLAKEVHRRTGDWASYQYEPAYLPHRFVVFKQDIGNHVVYTSGFKTAKACYEWAVAECKEKGLIR